MAGYLLKPDIYWPSRDFNYFEDCLYQTFEDLREERPDIEQVGMTAYVAAVNNELTIERVVMKPRGRLPHPLEEWEGYYSLGFRNKLLGLIHVIPSANYIQGGNEGLTRLIFDIRWPAGPVPKFDENNWQYVESEYYEDYMGQIRAAVIQKYQELYSNPENPEKGPALLEAPKESYQIREEASDNSKEYWQKYVNIRANEPYLDQKEVAEKLYITPRQLQRILKDLGHTWKDWGKAT